MKVGTDGVLLGAWADLTPLRSMAVPRVLDIGTGTGLIALMLAQRLEQEGQSQDGLSIVSTPLITALEIDKAAADQAVENVAHSPWSAQIEVHHGPVQAYPQATSTRYDLIVSNPPYFLNSMPASGRARTIARHADTLPFDELCRAVSQLLKPAGSFSIIFPADQFRTCQKISSDAGLIVCRCCWVKPTPTLPAKRVLITFTSQAEDISRKSTWAEETITLEMSRHQYTPEFQRHVQDFYLDKRYE